MGEAGTLTTTRLTAREVQVLRFICDGLTDGEIGGKLSISAETVKRYGMNIRDKTGMDNRVTMAMWAVREGLVKP